MGRSQNRKINRIFLQDNCLDRAKRVFFSLVVNEILGNFVFQNIFYWFDIRPCSSLMGVQFLALFTETPDPSEMLNIFFMESQESECCSASRPEPFLNSWYMQPRQAWIEANSSLVGPPHAIPLYSYIFIEYVPQAAFNAWSRSLIKSSLFSRPTERRILKNGYFGKKMVWLFCLHTKTLGLWLGF